MTLDFCTRTTTKIRRLGYPRRTACWYARLFFVSMLSVCTLWGYRGLSLATLPANTGTGIICSGPRAANVPVFSRIRRQ